MAKYTEREAYFPHRVGVCNSFISKLMFSHYQLLYTQEIKPDSD